MKVGICVTTHRSQNRKEGVKLLDDFFEGFKKSNFKYDYTIYVSDNESTIPYNYPLDLNIEVIEIADQSIDGLTGAWNKGLHRAYEDGCDILWNFNDDVIPNDTMNKFVESLNNYEHKDVSVCGPRTNNGGHQSPNTAKGVGEGITPLSIRSGSMGNIPNGFCFGFTRKYYETFRFKENQFFDYDHKMNSSYGVKDGRWGGQEGYFSLTADKGGKACIINECWLEHEKLQTWRTARKIYKGK